MLPNLLLLPFLVHVRPDHQAHQVVRGAAGPQEHDARLGIRVLDSDGDEMVLPCPRPEGVIEGRTDVGVRIEHDHSLRRGQGLATSRGRLALVGRGPGGVGRGPGSVGRDSGGVAHGVQRDVAQSMGDRGHLVHSVHVQAARPAVLRALPLVEALVIRLQEGRQAMPGRDARSAQVIAPVRIRCVRCEARLGHLSDSAGAARVPRAIAASSVLPRMQLLVPECLVKLSLALEVALHKRSRPGLHHIEIVEF